VFPPQIIAPCFLQAGAFFFRLLHDIASHPL